MRDKETIVMTGGIQGADGHNFVTRWKLDLREAPPKKIPKAFGHCPFGGVSTLGRMVWGNFFGKNLLDFGEV